MDKSKLPTNNMADASPTRKMYSATDVEQANLQVTPETQTGDLAFLRSQGVSQIDLDSKRRKKTAQRPS